MNSRKRLLKTLRFEEVDRVPDYEFGAWEQTIARWHEEGLPPEYDGVWDAITDYFQTDPMGQNMGFNIGLLPAFEHKVLEEKGDHIIVQNDQGAICEMLKPELGASIPSYKRYAIETRKDWQRIRDERLNPDDPERIPDDLEERCKESQEAEQPVIIFCGSIYGWLRNWMGVENLSLAIYDDPDWVEEMMEHLTELKITLYKKIAGKAKIDCGTWWEDMCFKSGSLISPEYFKKWMVPRYKRVTDFLRKECDCKFHMLDCDGDIEELVALWLEGGINVMFPLEAAHTNAFWISEQFGSRVALRGYFDKKALIAGKKAIDNEFERLVPLMKKGGFIPHTDHLVPPDVSWENYCYYREKKMKFIGKE